MSYYKNNNGVLLDLSSVVQDCCSIVLSVREINHVWYHGKLAGQAE